MTIGKQYSGYDIYPTTRNIEFTAEIPVRGSELVLSTAKLYKVGE